MRSTKQGAARPVAPLAALLAVLLAVTVPAVSGCSAERRAGAPRGPVTSTPAYPNQVVAVRLLVTGGIAGVHEVYRLTRAEAPVGVSAADAGRVLALAGRLAVDSHGDSARVAGGCCDRLLYDVTVRRADGTHERIRFGATQTPPAPLLRMAALLSAAS